MILAPVGMMQSIGTTVGSIYNAKGRTDWLFRWGIGSSLFIIIAFVIGLRWGIVGVATAYASATLSIQYFSFVIPFKLIELRFKRLLNVLWKPFMNSMIMLVVILAFTSILSATFSNVAVLTLSIMFGTVVYGTASWMNSKGQLKELWKLVGFNKGGGKLV